MNQDKILKKVGKISAAIPFVYLLIIAFFFLWVRMLEGHFPNYGNPDPKNYPLLHFTEVLLMLLVPLSFAIWLVMVVRAIVTKNWNTIKYVFFVGVIGFLLIVLLVKLDPMGVLNWLAD